MNIMAIKAIIAGCFFVLVGTFFFFQGERNIQAKWNAEKAELNAQAAIALKDAQERNAQIERDHQAAVLDIDIKYNKKLEKAANEKDIAIANAKSNGLFIPADCPNDSSAVSSNVSTASASHVETRAKLSESAGNFLISLASEADQVVNQLTACQEILNAK